MPLAVPKVAVIGGGGNVGSAIAFSLIAMKFPVTVLVVDIDDKLAMGQALDIGDAAFLSSGTCRMGTFEEAGQCDVIIITAGARQRPNEPRSELIGRNYSIIKSIVEKMGSIKKSSVILMVTNPVDILTDIAQKVSGLPRNQVIGSGTFLDSGRLRNELSNVMGIAPSSIHSGMMGEHGDAQFAAWSMASVGGTPLLEHPKLKNVNLDELEKGVSRKAYEIIEAKGSTYYGVGMHVAHIAKSILGDECKVYPVCTYVDEYQCYLSVPAIVGSTGSSTLPLNLSDAEQEKLKSAANKIKSLCDKY
ncbi:L-lactate dehydrogenase A [Zancudomyces culisetae]|uniref:L-lactate dehydrogenase A n=1 Tax=Zancudomyces culisetae TaxID=1213189 RepID=A0A1R1PWH8_ZANCU|nr:L-lactate dehydrogenase A [Zancudomyces culisetae]|eukprot:OMH85279.1 L-lactate dehydrogenase A [Zancudomyces culisetae]